MYTYMVYFTLEVLTEGLNMYQKASTYDRRSQLIIITGSVVLLTSIVSILVRSNLSIELYHPTTSLSRNFLWCKEIAEIARRNTQNELDAAQEKSDFSFNFNCFSQRKAGKVYIVISEGNSILWFLKHLSKYEIKQLTVHTFVNFPRQMVSTGSCRYLFAYSTLCRDHLVYQACWQ